MAGTTLAFYRQAQSLEDLSSQRPKSLDTVRTAILSLVDDIETRLNHVQHLFYDGSNSHDDFIKENLPDIRRSMRDFNVTYIHASYQMDELQQWASGQDHDTHALAVILNYHKKLTEFLPSFFTPFIDDLKTCIDYSKRYLLSFFHGARDTYVETAFHYEMKRREIERAIKMHVKNIANMAAAYRTQRGLNVKMFGFSSNELARRCDVGDLPILLAFPEACMNIRNSCEGVRKWVKADQQYPEFLKMDINELEQKHSNQLKTVRECKDSVYHEDHRVRAIMREIDELEEDIRRLHHRDVQLCKQVEQLLKEKHNMNLDIQIKEQEREDYRAISKTDKIAQLANEISRLRFQLPEMDRKLENVHQKMSLITERKELLAVKKKQLREKKEEVSERKQEMKKSQEEMSRITVAISKLKDIYSRKTSNDVTKKIFHDLPVEPRNARLLPVKPKVKVKATKQNDKDHLAIAIRVVSRHIEGDWAKLYRLLPFYPDRGKLNIDEDVIKTVKEHHRNTDQVKAQVSLDRWRRLHSRANVADLESTLTKLGRKDLCTKIQRTLHPPPPQLPKVQQRWRKIRHIKFAMGKLIKLQANHPQQTETKGADALGRPKGGLPAIWAKARKEAALAKTAEEAKKVLVPKITIS